jgi:hypothetical protein
MMCDVKGIPGEVERVLNLSSRKTLESYWFSDFGYHVFHGSCLLYSSSRPNSGSAAI